MASQANPFSDPAVSNVAVPPEGAQMPAGDTSKMQGMGNTVVQGDTSPPWLSESGAPENPSWTHLPAAEEGDMTQSGPLMSSAGAPTRPQAPVKPTEETICGYTLKQLTLYMRLGNVVAAVLMMLSALTSLLGNVSLSTFVLSLYVSCFGCLLCCFETHLKHISVIIADNFGFMYSATGRFTLYVLLATLCFTFNIIGIITGCILLTIAVFNLLVLYKFPEYQKITQDEDRRGESSQSVQTMASSMAVNYIASNPDKVAGAAQAGAKWAYENPEVAAHGVGAFAAAHQQHQQQAQGAPSYEV